MTSLITEGGASAAAGASGAAAYAWLLVALPLIGAAVLLLGGRRTDKVGPYLAVAMSWASFLVGLVVILQLAGLDPQARTMHLTLWSWIPAGAFQLNVGMLVDPLSMAFVMLVTFVGSLIHVYSLGYMSHDPDKRKFFAYLNLFVAAMLLLVLADSYLLLFVGWEGVGLASYLLIGFWNWNPAYATAANKAFVVNRVGDLGLTIAILVMFVTFGGVDYTTVNAGVAHANQGAIVAMGLLLLLGATGKSAQFPLQSWLGDAMAGPTPVSALIHAATMVTAGVYLVVRSHVIYDAAPDAALAVAIVGAITLMFGAIVGTAKDDIKKALAASTMSQIGYMMLAAGLGPVGYAFAIFHLLTHGFFKAGMFLGAGSVMHGMNDQVNMRRFGNLSAVMKVTWATFGLGYLAIIGFPFLSGYFSKDRIIEAAFVGEGWKPWVLGGVAMIGAGITAFYMSRLFFMTFQGRARWTDEVHPHESPLVMTVPMMVLGFGSAFLGLILAWPFASEMPIVSWLAPVVGEHAEAAPVIPPLLITVLTLAFVAVGAWMAYTSYWREDVPEVAPRGNALTRAARVDLYQDAVNEGLFMRPGVHLTRALVFADAKGVDGAVGGSAALVGGLSSRLRRIQTGYARSYALTMLTGVVAVLGALWVIQ